jgi:hypothetical protein
MSLTVALGTVPTIWPVGIWTRGALAADLTPAMRSGDHRAVPTSRNGHLFIALHRRR